MKSAAIFVCFRAALFAAAAVLTCDGTASWAAEGASGPQGDSWDSIKQLPDFSGVWQVGSFNPVAQFKDNPLPLNPVWKKKSDELASIRAKGGDIEGRAKYCIALGFPGGMVGPEEIHEFLYTPGQVTMTDVQGYVRRIYTDGRKHHTGPENFWGDSIGHWEGNVLVVDTIGMQHNNEIAYGLSGGRNMHVTERMFLKDKDTMQIDTVIDAPDAFTRPYVSTALFKNHRDWEMTEWDCAQNNRDLNGEGKQQMNLVPPDEGPSTAPLIPNHGPGSRKDNG